MNNQNLFEALQRVCNFTATQGDMDEIINAYEQDLKPKENGIPKPPKVVVAVIDGWFTKGKEYDVISIDGYYSENIGFGFYATDDSGKDQYCLEKRCAHQAGEDWIIKEREL